MEVLEGFKSLIVVVVIENFLNLGKESLVGEKGFRGFVKGL